MSKSVLTVLPLLVLSLLASPGCGDDVIIHLPGASGGGLGVVAAGASGVVRYSGDGGSTWNAGASGTANLLMGSAFDGVLTWMVVGLSGTAISSTDGGAGWTLGGATGTTMNALATDGAGRWIATGNGGAMRASTDGGGTWSLVISGTGSLLNGIATDGAGWPPGQMASRLGLGVFGIIYSLSQSFAAARSVNTLTEYA